MKTVDVRMVAFQVAGLLLMAGQPRAQAQHLSSSNGVYGGYVASDQWFHSMTQNSGGSTAAAHAEWERARQNALQSGKWVETAIVVLFPGGNRFPDGTVPDIAVLDPAGKDQGVFPYSVGAAKDHSVYYVMLRRGKRYSAQWTYSFGSKEIFGSFAIPDKGDSRVTILIPYRPSPPSAAHEAKAAEGVMLVHSNKGYVLPKSDGKFVAPTVGPGFVAPKAGPGFTAPSIGPGLQPPSAGPPFRAPQTGPGFRAPASG